MSGEIEGS